MRCAIRIPARHSTAAVPRVWNRSSRGAAASLRCSSASAAFQGRSTGGNTLDRPTPSPSTGSPKYDTGRDTDAGGGGRTATETGRGGTTLERSRVTGGGNYRVLLLDSEAHTEARVVKAIVAVVPQADETYARNCFATSKQLGLALVVTCLKEHAEHYRQQLFNLGLRTSMEPDTSTL